MKRIISAALLLFVTIGTHAQHTAGEWSVTPRVGVDLSKFTNDYVYTSVIDGTKKINSSYKEGLTAGADLEYFLHEHVSLSAGLYYMNMGSRYKDFMIEDQQGGTGSSHYRTSMDFLQMPLMGSLYLNNGLAVRLGVQLGRMLNSKTSYEMQSWTRDDDGARDYAAPIKSEGDIVDEWKQNFYFSVPVAIAYEFQNVILEARYLRSFTHPMKADIYKDSYHSTFVFTIGYRVM